MTEDLKGRARALIEIGRYDQAVAVLARRIASEPADAEALVLLASAHYQRGDRRAALEAANGSVAITPDNEWPHRLRALSLAALGRRDQAREAAQNAVRLAPNMAVTHIALATVLTNLGEPVAAYQPARKAVELAPNSADAHILLGQVAAANGDKEAARTSVARALEIDPANATALRVMATIDLRAGKLRQAANLLLSAVRLDPRATSTVATLDVVGIQMTGRLLRRLLIAMTIAGVLLAGLALAPEMFGTDNTVVLRLVVGLVLVVSMVVLVVLCVRTTPVELRSSLVAALRRIPVGGWALLGAVVLLVSLLVLLPTQSARVPALFAVPVLVLVLLGSFGKRRASRVVLLVLVVIGFVFKLAALSQSVSPPPIPILSISMPPGPATGTAGIWTERLCTQLEPIGQLSGDFPPLLPPGTPKAEITQAEHDFLAKQTAKRDTVLAAVRAMDAPPVADGQTVRTSLIDALQADRDTIAKLDTTTDFSSVRKQGFDRVLAVINNSPELRADLQSSLSCTLVR